MRDGATDRNPLDLMAEEYVRRHRLGERPRLDEFVGREPGLADEIRRLLPAALLLDSLRPTADDLSSSAEPDDPTGSSRGAPSRLGDFRIIREIGRGGMGVVYEAEQESLGRRVALKVLSRTRELSDPTLQRFRVEAKAAARLHHSNIVPVFGVGEEDGVPFYVMQYIDGQGLDSVLRELRRLRGAAPPAAGPQAAEPVSEPTALSQQGSPYWRSVARLGADVAAALQYAHDAGILHRDVKPSNLLLDTRGVVWVTDFGLAKLQDHPDLTRDDDVIGTVRYMAPERFEGRCDARCDVYSLGLVLYELLTLRQAYGVTDRHRLIRQITHEDPPRPRELDRLIPLDLETVVLKAIARHPADRYASAAELSQDLRRFLEDRPVVARRAGGAERLRRWCRRNPSLAALVLTLAALLVTLAAGSLLVAARFRHWAAQERLARADADAARLAAERTLARLYPANGLAAAERGDDAVAALWFAHAAALATPGSEHQQLQLTRARAWAGAAVEPVAAFHCGLPDDSQIAFEGAGRYLVVRGRGGAPDAAGAWHCAIWDVEQGVEMTLPGARPDVRCVAIAAEGKLAAVATDAGVEVLDLSSRATTWTLDHVTAEHVSLSADGKRLLVATAEHFSRVYDLGGGRTPILEARHEGPSPPLMTANAVITADGNQLTWRGLAEGQVLQVQPVAQPPAWLCADEQGRVVAAAVAGQVRLFDAATGRPLKDIDVHPDLTRYGSLGGDGKLLLLAGDRGAPVLWSVESSSPVGPNLSALAGTSAAAISPDGRRFASLAAGVVRLWAQPRGALPTKRIPLSAPNASVRIDRSGKFLLPCGMGTNNDAMRSTRVFDIATGEPAGPELAVDGVIHGGEFSPDGKSVAVISSGGANALRLWRDFTGAAPPLVRPLPAKPVVLAFDSSGSRLCVLCADGTVSCLSGSSLDVVQSWTTTPPELDQVLIRHGGVRFFPDGKSVVSWGDLTADVRDAESGAPRYAPPHHEGRCFDVDFSSDGKFLATAGYDRTARVWEAATGRPAAAPLVHAAPVYRVRFAPGGGLITDCLDGAVHVWDWKAGRATTEAKTPKYAFVASASPDGRWLLAGCDGESLRLLSLATGEPVAPAVALSGAPWTVEISADGKYTAVAGSGSAVDVIDLSPLDAVAERPAVAVLRAELTSGLRIVDGELKPLTPAEWFQRWAGRGRANAPRLR